ncbi:uncharacterized abhydrolase domain-containing protein DDB_G0269086-like [Littorina saxatilis]|uniref:uncharacterized abhydrolase domain-containing protein DDB_G0269086-like n=1 Tax=Littorina saxatilis TaxID=31220 RepID=UPI0038B4603E
MAEAREEVRSLAPEGRVEEGKAGLLARFVKDPAMHSQIESVRNQFRVHEDGALAYQIQEREIEQHYGLNRYNRRTVREDIPVAKVVQTQEEIEQQKERLRKLAALQAQAEADEIVARRVNRQIQDEARRTEVVREIEDEELARQLQDKEKAKYEKYLQKKRERKLKKEREKLEQELAKNTEEARLTVHPAADGSNTDQARQDMEALRLQGASPANGVTRYQYRVTPAGHIEDDGDFSDFFAVPPDNLHPEEWEKMQQQQDEELARLLQEQEHKRTKAEVDKHKLREIEQRDEQLAVIIQEQEKLKDKKYKQKLQQRKEQKKLEKQHSEGLPLGASANMLSQMGPTATATDHNHHLYRRNSYTKSIDNGPAPVDYGPDGVAVDRRGITVSRSLGAAGGREEWLPRGTVDGRPQMPAPQQSQGPMHRTVIEVNNPHPHSQARTPTSQPPPRRQVPSSELSPDDAPEVLRWLQSQGAPVVAPNHGNDPRDEEVAGLTSQGNGFNIATAIDPTYHRRQTHPDDLHTTAVKTSVPVSRSLPLAEGAIEWEPGVRGSLRRLKGTLNPLITAQETPTSADGSNHDSSFEEGSQGGSFQPVQGQKRSTLDNRNRKARKPNAAEAKGGKNSSCKQQ